MLYIKDRYENIRRYFNSVYLQKTLESILMKAHHYSYFILQKLQSKRLAKEYEEKISKNIEQRKTVTKSLKQRTKRGQPVMANQIEHILQKVKMTSS